MKHRSYRPRRHAWERYVFPSMELRLSFPWDQVGERCSDCHATRWNLGDRMGTLRWRFTDGSLFDQRTVDEPDCPGPQMDARETATTSS